MMVDGIEHLDLDGQGGGDVTEKADAPSPPAPPAPAGGNGTRKRAPPIGPPQISADTRAAMARRLGADNGLRQDGCTNIMEVLGNELAAKAERTSANHRDNEDLRKPPGSQAATGPKAGTMMATIASKVKSRKVCLATLRKQLTSRRP